MAKQIQHHLAASAPLAAGALLLADTVGGTLGPAGRNVCIHTSGSAPMITNDGASIAGDVTLYRPTENMGVQLLKEASLKTNREAGDGSTTSLVLAGAILREGMKCLATGADPLALRRGIEKATAAAIRDLSLQRQEISGIEDLRRIATLSSGDELCGQLLAQATHSLPSDGVILVEPSPTLESSLTIREGLSCEGGYVSPYMLTPEEQVETTVENPYILVADQTIASPVELLPLLEQLMKADGKMVIFAADIAPEVVSALTVNRKKGVFDVICAKAPAVGELRSELLGDIATATGGQLFTPATGLFLREGTLDYLGQAKEIRLTAHGTLILGGAGTERNRTLRIGQIRTQLAQADDELHRTQLMGRLSMLCGKVAVINVGAATEVERQDKKLRIEDALHALRAAVEEGVVAGGGAAYVHAAAATEKLCRELSGDEAAGAAVLTAALSAPLLQIAENSGYDGSAVRHRIDQANSSAYGFDAARDLYGDFLELGILDPLKVCRCALENAASAAAAILTADAAISNPPARLQPMGKRGKFSIFDE